MWPLCSSKSRVLKGRWELGRENQGVGREPEGEGTAQPGGAPRNLLPQATLPRIPHSSLSP